MGKVVAVLLVLAGLVVLARLERGGSADIGHVEGHVFGYQFRVDLTFMRSRDGRSPTATPVALPDAYVLPDSLREVTP
jgi:hypothetical protein